MGNSFCCCSEPLHPRKSITRKQAAEIYKRCEGHCFYCNKHVGAVARRKNRYEIDHLKPVAENGASDMKNYVVACFDCNRRKSKKPVDLWLQENHFPRRCIHLVPETGLYCREECFTESRKYCIRHQIGSHLL
jgi:5-methylcytosine-specific restriction endonuclease McrA